MCASAKYKRTFSQLVKNTDYYQYIVDHLPARTTATPENTPSPDGSISPDSTVLPESTPTPVGNPV